MVIRMALVRFEVLISRRSSRNEMFVISVAVFSTKEQSNNNYALLLDLPYHLSVRKSSIGPPNSIFLP